MTVLSQNVEDMLKRLETQSKSELNLIRALSDAIRQVDEAALRELRNLTLSHELRRESILGELHMLAGRLCQLPAKSISPVKPAIPQQSPPLHEPSAAALDIVSHDQARPHHATPLPHNGAASHAGIIHAPATAMPCETRAGGDWRQAAQNIADDLDYAFAASPRPRH